jgi:hypothetical protein
MPSFVVADPDELHQLIQKAKMVACLKILSRSEECVFDFKR